MKAGLLLKLERWYRQYVVEKKRQGIIPSADENLGAARSTLGQDINRDLVRQVRARLAPSFWTQKGRRKK